MTPIDPTEATKRIMHLMEEQSFLMKKMYEANQKFFLNLQEILNIKQEKGDES
jgi:hypothetical protein